jgi:hypothetical protein
VAPTLLPRSFMLVRSGWSYFTCVIHAFFPCASNGCLLILLCCYVCFASNIDRFAVLCVCALQLLWKVTYCLSGPPRIGASLALSCVYALNDLWSRC